MKKCFKCKQEKEINLFYKNRSTKDGYSGICKQCQGENERTNNLLTKQWVEGLKKECSKCGDNRHWVLDFHHVNPSKKTISISVYSISGTASFETKKKKILQELENCILLCANCHRDYHYQEKQMRP